MCHKSTAFRQKFLTEDSQSILLGRPDITAKSEFEDRIGLDPRNLLCQDPWSEPKSRMHWDVPHVSVSGTPSFHHLRTPQDQPRSWPDRNVLLLIRSRLYLLPRIYPVNGKPLREPTSLKFPSWTIWVDQCPLENCSLNGVIPSYVSNQIEKSLLETPFFNPKQFMWYCRKRAPPSWWTLPSTNGFPPMTSVGLVFRSHRAGMVYWRQVGRKMRKMWWDREKDEIISRSE